MSSSGSYTYKSSGSNSQGNPYAARDQGSSSSNPNPYRYTNTSELDCANPRSSTYSNKSNGGTTYTSASGYRTCSGYGKK
ncbi:hypothetical protein LZ31DRAFT_599260 [Colletotrichum somersetense]|nr:hypothetical protein LZ31DRAFT_599260 [Colletotrichum somersetense]